MKRATVRQLHLETSEIIRLVADGEAFVVEKKGQPVAEIRPISETSLSAKLPDRERMIRRLPRVKTDSGRILEQDRT